MKSTFAALILLFSCNAVFAQSAGAIIDQMRSKIKTVNKSSFELHSKERFGSKYVYKKMKFNMQTSPRKVYMKDMDKGVELLYVDGWNNNKAYINPSGFPWINVSLSRYDSKVVAENHHTLDDIGLSFVLELLAGFEKAALDNGKDPKSLYTHQGTVTWNEKSCDKIEINSPIGFKYMTYTTKQDISLMKLSRKIFASDYLMKEKNNLNYVRTIRKGTSLTVPNMYAKRAVVYIEKSTKLPLVQTLYDDKGMLEHFEYKNVNLSPQFHSKEFTDDCPNYGF